jgi:hypothetical protein
MKRYSAVVLLAVVMIANVAYAQSWLQSGASGGSDSSFNYGASASIQSIYQSITNESLGFWVGETLANGAFAQVGYEIVDQSASYPSYCSPTGCSAGTTYIEAGVPAWFWEYFPANSTDSAFYGGMGDNASAGANGAFNTYSFRSSGNMWSFYFNNELIGSVNLGTPSSGRNSPSAIAEIAGASSNNFVMKVVQFKDVAFYNGDNFLQLPSAYSQIGYGKGSERTVQNIYGVQEVDHRINYFEVGSGLPTQSGTLLWQFGYSLNVVSQYGNLTGSGNYSAYVPVTLHAPGMMNLNSSIREVFEGWRGTGMGSYTGNASTITVTMNSNIEETALWQRQYYLNTNSTYNSTSGAGWYDANSTATLHVIKNIIGIANGTRLVFAGWDNGVRANSTTVLMDAPRNITASWSRQYFVSVTAPYGSTTGTGWYGQNSTADVSLTESFVQTGNESRLAFFGWSNGDSNASMQVLVDKPITLSAQFSQQYLMRLVAEDAYGAILDNVVYYNISSNRISNNSVFLFSNKKYNVEYIYYKSTAITLDYEFEATSPGTISIKAPVYDVAVSARSMFGTPVNATVNATFKNGTNTLLHTGMDGVLVLRDVPYGYVTGYAKYFGLTENINLAEGVGASLTFVTPSLVIVILAGIAIIVLVSIISIYYRDHFMRRAQGVRQKNSS